MYSEGNRGALAIALVGAIVLAAGLGLGGFLVGKGMTRFKADARTVTVKGLVEREVASDQAQWLLGFKRAGDSLPDAQAKLASDREAVLRFLREKGFTEAEIEIQPARSADRLAQEFSVGQQPRFRYVVAAGVPIRTPRVDQVRAAASATDELLKQGVSLDISGGEQRANPRYIVTRFNDLRPQLLAEATKNARTIAGQFAADSGAEVGAIHSANQGNIQIFGSDGNDESGPWSPTSTPTKRIRVVSTFEFELR